MVAPEDGSPLKAEAMVLTFPPDEALVVYVTRRGLDKINMMEQAQGVVVQPAHRVGEHREESNVEGKVLVGVCAGYT